MINALKLYRLVTLYLHEELFSGVRVGAANPTSFSSATLLLRGHRKFLEKRKMRIEILKMGYASLLAAVR